MSDPGQVLGKSVEVTDAGLVGHEGVPRRTPEAAPPPVRVFERDLAGEDLYPVIFGVTELSDSGLLWFINSRLFHPIGFALALAPMGGFQIMGSGREPMEFTMAIDAAKTAAMREAGLDPILDGDSAAVLLSGDVQHALDEVAAQLTDEQLDGLSPETRELLDR